MPYNLPYSEYVDADPTVEDMNSVVNVKVRYIEKCSGTIFIINKFYAFLNMSIKETLILINSYLLENSTLYASGMAIEQICFWSINIDERELATYPIGETSDVESKENSQYS